MKNINKENKIKQEPKRGLMTQKRENENVRKSKYDIRGAKKRMSEISETN